MTFEPLEVDTSELTAAGERFGAAAKAIPEPPSAFVPTGADPLSMAIAGQAPKLIAPIAAGLPALKDQTTRFAQNVLNAARRYATDDGRIANNIERQLSNMPGPNSGGSEGGSGPAGAPETSAAAAGASAATGGGQQAGQTGQLGQLMGMPVQLAAQAAQAPMQAMGMAAAIPQVAMQAAQQLGQLADTADVNAEQDNQTRDQAESADTSRDDAAPEPLDEAAVPAQPVAGPGDPGAGPGTAPIEPIPESTPADRQTAPAQPAERQL